MIIAGSIILLTLCVLFYRFTLTVPDIVLSAFHIPLWLTLGVVGGVVAWLIADD